MEENVQLSMSGLEMDAELKNKFGSTMDFINKCQELLTEMRDKKCSNKIKYENLCRLLKCMSIPGHDALYLKAQSDDEQSKREFLDFVRELAKELYDSGKVQQYRGKEDVGYVVEDFTGIGEISTVSMQCFCILLTKPSIADIDLNCDVWKCITLYALLLSCEHQGKDLWTTDSSLILGDKLLRKILEVRRVSIYGLLCGTENTTGIYEDVLSILLPCFTRNNWKQYPSMKQVYTWCLLHVKFPKLSDYLEQILSPALLLVDDHEVTNKCLGIRCLDHIIGNTSMTELVWYGRADVIYDSLQKLTYSHEASIIELLHPCMLKILAVLEKKSKDMDSLTIASTHDKMLQQLLSNMETETKLVMRRAYSQHLPSYIIALGIGSVKHFKHLFPVIFSYLEVYDGPQEQSRIYILNALKQTILECWPRIPGHCQEIIKSLVRLIYDISTDHTLTPDDVKNIMMTEAGDCLILLKRLCTDQVTSALQAIIEVGLGPECDEYIRNILMSE